MSTNLLYIVRAGGDNDELRYSLRSTKMISGRKTLTIVGDCPSWLNPDYFIEGNPFPIDKAVNKQRNVTHNMLVACQSESVPENLLLMNDDFFFMRPIKYTSLNNTYFVNPRTLNVRVAEDRLVSWLHGAYSRTIAILKKEGYSEALNFDLHVPMPIKKSLMLEMLTTYKDSHYAKRSLYGNLYLRNEELEYIQDNKIRDFGGLQHESWMISTADATWPIAQPFLGSFFYEPSPWEV